MAVKLLLETLRLANGGSVVCDVSTSDGAIINGVIEQTFFEEFAAMPQSKALSAQRHVQIVRDNLGYLEAEAERQWSAGMRELVIR
jgi:hypothetical protein